MKKTLSTLVPCALVALFLLAPLALAEEKAMTVTGEATKVDTENGQLGLKSVEGDSMVFKVDDRTRILHDGEKVGLGDISPGDRLTVNYAKSGDAMVALAIGVHRPEA